MFCIAAFIVFLVLGIFSATYRHLAGKAWYCVLRKITFRPCDINFKEEMKGKLLGKVIFTHPKLAKFLAKWIDALAGIFVILSLWSLLVVFLSGLNLLVYDSCNPNDAQSCSLSGEACSIGTAAPGFLDSLAQGKPHEWLWHSITQFGTTISLVPNRFKYWDPTKYLATQPSYAADYDSSKPTTLEIVDPGCIYCAKLTKNLEAASTFETNNVSYLLYPIPMNDGYKFQHSKKIALWILAIAEYEQQTQDIQHRDWQLLKHIFMDDAEYGSLQNAFNVLYSSDQADEKLKKLTKGLGFTDQDITNIQSLTESDTIHAKLEEMQNIVEQRIHTIKIPTLLHDGRRFDRVVGVDTLKKQ